jgi:hypothetical protein
MAGKISFVGVKSEIEPIPSGAYESEFVSYKVGTVKPGSANAGQMGINLQFAVSEDGDYKNHRLFRYCVMTPDSLWAFKRTMSALGADVDWEDPEGVDPEEIAKSVLHKRVIVKVLYDPEGFEDPITKERKPSNSVQDVVPTESQQLENAEMRASLPQAAAEPTPVS